MSEFTRRTMVGAMAAAPAVATALKATPATAQTPARNIGLPSRHFQFTPSLQETVDLCKEAGFDAIEWNIRVGGHVDPSKVETLLPQAVEAAHKVGLKTEQVCTNIVDPNTPYAENILRAMQAAGIRYYRSSNYFQWVYDKDFLPQLEALRPRFAALAALNSKYGTTACFHTHPTIGDIGGNVWDMFYIMRDFDPTNIAFNYDTCHTTIRGGNGWRAPAYAAKRHIQALAVKDLEWIIGGPTAPNVPLWRVNPLPCGEGMVDFKGRFEFLRDVGFAGPINIHYEHFGLYGTAIGDMKIDLTRAQFVRVIKHDLDFVRGVMRDTKFMA